jgi:hypothetical protein
LTRDDVVPQTSISLAPPYTGGPNIVDPQLKTPRTAEWNVALQRSFGPSQSVSVTYAGNRAQNLLQLQQYTGAVNPNFNSFYFYTIAARDMSLSNYSTEGIYEGCKP